MKAPRWLRTAGGAKFIDGVEIKAGYSLTGIPADIIAGLKNVALHCQRFSRQAGRASSTLVNVLTCRWPKSERLIAEVSVVAPDKILPSRSH